VESKAVPADSTGTRDTPSTGDDTASEDDEDAMAKKRKKNRGAQPGAERQSGPAPSGSTSLGDNQSQKKPEVRQEVRQEAMTEARTAAAAAKDAEAQSNVIQFPSQTKRSVATTQVAVNDDTVAVSSGGGVEMTDDDELAQSEPPPAGEDAARAGAESAEDHDEELSDEREYERGRPGPGEIAKVTVSSGKKHEPIAPPPSYRKDKRAKKPGMTSTSGEIRAVAGTGENPEVAEDFFKKKASVPPQADDDFDDLQFVAQMSPDQRRWRNGTIGMLIASALMFGAFQLWNHMVIPQPVPLGTGGPVELPRLAQHTTESTGAAGIRGSAGTQRLEEEGSTVPVVGTAPAGDPLAEGAPIEGAVEEGSLVEGAVEGAPIEGAVEGAPVEGTPVEPAPVEIGTVEVATSAPVEAAPVEAAPVAAEATPAPEAAPAAASASYEALIEQATRGRSAQRIELYQQAIAVNPSGSEALSQLSFLLLNRGRGTDVEMARDHARRATEVDATNALAWLVLGASLDSLRDRAGARAAYQQCVEHGTGRHVGECRAMLR
jgi:hypothetical protein